MPSEYEIKMSKLGGIVEMIAHFSVAKLRVLYDLAEHLWGEGEEDWLYQLKKFLRKEQSWVGACAEKKTFLKCISGNESLVIDAVDGSKLLKDAKDTFAEIDPNFKNWGADASGWETPETPVRVYRMKKDATFAQMFGSLGYNVEKIYLCQDQILNFVRKYQAWLRTGGYATFFLFQSKENLFVAKVYFTSLHSLYDSLSVRIYQFGHIRIWRADKHRRVVIPQLA
ncbi:MAG: hypothetical protein HY764_02490 [Candidatus Portnoybacteria bacterium]|nr:hypothetical protein [Candidatus Portnoybacteria bacterium]